VAFRIFAAYNVDPTYTHMMHADEQQPAAQSSNESSEGGSQGTGEGRRGRRRRGRGRRGGDGQPRPGQEASGAEDASEHASEHADAGGHDDDRPSSSGSESGSEGGSEQERSKRKRRRKKKSGQNAGEAAGAAATDGEEGDDAGDTAEAAPAGQQKQQQQQPRQQQQRNERRRDDKGGEKKERAPRGSVLQRRATRGDYDDTPKVKDEPAPVLAPINAINVDAYIGHFKGWQREVLTTLRAIVRQGAGDIDESILWSQPVFSSNGPVCYIKAFSDHVNFGFWRGIDLDDPDGLLVGDLTMMRHITIRHVNDVKRDVFEAMVRQAVRLNRDKGDPTMS